MKNAARRNKNLLVDTDRSNGATTIQVSSNNSSGLSPGRKQIIFNKQKSALTNNNRNDNILIAKSTGSQDYEEHSILKEAKLPRQSTEDKTSTRDEFGAKAAVYQGKPAEANAVKQAATPNDFNKLVEDSIPIAVAEEDPIVALKKRKNNQLGKNQSIEREP